MPKLIILDEADNRTNIAQVDDSNYICVITVTSTNSCHYYWCYCYQK